MKVLFLLLSFVEVLAVIMFMFLLFRIPIKEYRTKLISLALWSTGISFVIREVLQFAEIDPIIQVVLIVLFLRISLEMKIFYSSLIVLVGYIFYIITQMLVYYIWVLFDTVHLTDAIVTTEFGTYLIQFSSIVAISLISYIIHYFNLGFSFIIRPPHQLDYKEKWNRTNLMILASLGVAVISMGLAFWLLMNLKVFSLLPILVITLAFLYFLSDKRERTQHD